MVNNIGSHKVSEDIVELHVPFEIITIKSLHNRRKHVISPGNIFDWHRIEFNALLIVTNGSGKHHIDCEEYELESGAIIPLVKGQIHRFDEDEPIDGIAVTFTEEFVLKNISEKNTLLFLKIFHLPQLQIDEEHISILTPFIELLFKEQAIKNANLKGDIIRNLLITLFLYIERLTPLEFTKSSTKRFQDFVRFKNLISQKINTTHNAKEYAEELNLSYKYINDISKELSGKTAKAFIDSWLVTEIKRELSQKRHSMKEISYRVGFDEPTNFIRFFKKNTGTTPKAFELQIK